MVGSATHNPFASYGRLPPTRAAGHDHRDAQRVARVGAKVPGGSRPQPSCPAAELKLLLALRLSLADSSEMQHDDAVDNGDSAPELDASAATVTSAESRQSCGEQPQPVTRTADEFQHNLSGPEPAVGFEGRQGARFHLLSQPFF